MVTTYAGGGSHIGLFSIGAYLDANDTNARFNTPSGLAIDRNGNLYVADLYNHRIGIPENLIRCGNCNVPFCLRKISLCITSCAACASPQL